MYCLTCFVKVFINRTVCYLCIQKTKDREFNIQCNVQNALKMVSMEIFNSDLLIDLIHGLQFLWLQ